MSRFHLIPHSHTTTHTEKGYQITPQAGAHIRQERPCFRFQVGIGRQRAKVCGSDLARLATAHG